jgi:hypothetical protein
MEKQKHTAPQRLPLQTEGFPRLVQGRVHQVPHNYLTWNNIVGTRRGGLAEKAMVLLDLVVSALFSETSLAIPNRSPLPILVKNQSKGKL